MKKIVLLSLLLTTLALADAKVYVGGGYAYYDEQINYANSNLDETTSSNSGRIKLGYGERKAYAIELSMDYIDANPTKYAFDINLIKAFDWDIYVYPFVKVGFGAGFVDSTNNNNDTLSYGSFNLGTGVFIPINETLDFEVSYEYKNLSYQEETDASNNSESRTSHVNIGYLGLNIRF